MQRIMCMFNTECICAITVRCKKRFAVWRDMLLMMNDELLINLWLYLVEDKITFMTVL